MPESRFPLGITLGAKIVLFEQVGDKDTPANRRMLVQFLQCAKEPTTKK